MKDLKDDIKNNSIRTLYLFYGEEGYLKQHYEGALIDAVVTGVSDMNKTYFSEKEATSAAIIDTAETMPFFSDRRIIIVRSSGLFESGRKEESEKISEYFSQIPETTCIVFIEDSVDKRLKTFKNLQKYGLSVEFKTPNDNGLSVWIQKLLKKEKLLIETDAIFYLIRCCGGKMNSIYSEISKLISYKNSGETISLLDVDTVVVKTVESKIFDLVEAIGNKKPAHALEVYHNLLLNKEHPVMILGMITRQFRLVYQAKYLQQKGLNSNQIEESMGQRNFIVKECISEGRNFTIEALKKALNDCLSTDTAIKSGKIDGALGVEILIADYSRIV